MGKRYLYGKTEEKHVQLQKEEEKKKLKPLDTYRFKLNPLLEGKPKIKRNEASIRYKTTPDTLVELCSPVVNAIPLPQPMHWTILDVADWIRKLGFPQYQNTFKANYIDGRNLLRIDASYLVKMNIRNMDHIRTITNSIRHLYKFNRSSYKRSISMPDRSPDALYKFFRVRTGPKYERTRRTDLYRRLHLLRRQPLYEIHWQKLERWLKHMRPIDTELVGKAGQKRYNLFYPPKQKIVPDACDKNDDVCNCMPPCTCSWTMNRELREPWKLKKLENRPQWEKHRGGLTILVVNLPQKYGALDKKIKEVPFKRLTFHQFTEKLMKVLYVNRIFLSFRKVSTDASLSEAP